MIAPWIRQTWHKIAAPIDEPLMVFVLLLLGVSLLALTSAAPERLTSQLFSMGIALVFMRIVAQIPPQQLMHTALPIYVFGVLLLIAVALFGDVSKGARRWLNLGFMRIQPSELMKIAVPMMLAWYFQKRETMLRLKDYFVATLLLLLP
ncbi:MAG: FtsW/RodA/SpoVE family cell cycle protein, partial [Rhodocyclaceae bacterium]|nr:FtsW/RodA/SpoVE family cell cycle protein [Rhodocyclaceae bacterium]